MRETTEAYRAAVYADARWSDVLVRFRLVDITAAGDATPAASNEARLSQLAQTHDETDGMGGRFITLEDDYWALDGTFTALNEDVSDVQTGWWSGALSNEHGVFSVPLVLSFTFTQSHTSMGFTIHFDEAAGEWATEFTIATFDASGVRLSMDAVRDNAGPVYVSAIPAEKYRRVEITFYRTSKPYRRVRVSEVIFGAVQTFTGDNTERVTLLYELDPKMETLPTGELAVTFDNRAHAYNLINPNGIYRFLQEGQPLDTFLGVGASKEEVALVPMGRHYYYRAKAADSGMTAEIVARDRFSLLEKGSYRRGENRQDTVENLVADILADSGTGLTARIPAEIAAVTISRALPVCTHREALRLVAQAACAACFLHRDDVLCFTRLTEGEIVDVLDLDNLEMVPDVEVADPVNTVEASAYTLQDAGTEARTDKLFEGVVDMKGETELWAVYSAPARNAAATVTSGTLVSAQYFLYAARLVLTGNGQATVVVNGVPLNRSESVYTLRQAGPGETEQSVRVENPLISTTAQAQALARWRLGLERRRLTYPLKERGNPARELTDTVQVFDAYGENRNAVMIRQELTFDTALGGTSTAWGGGL